MGVEPRNDWAMLAASALEWWDAAGVDMLVDDEVRDWRAEPSSPLPAPATVAAVAPAQLPDTLDAFVAWRLSDAAPEHAWGTPMIAPEGAVASDLMIVVDQPEDGAMAGGAAGRLLDAMLAAIGRTRSDVYLAALAHATPPAGRIAPDDEARLAELARHHIALTGARRVLILTDQASRAILGTSRAPLRGRLHGINHGERNFDAVASVHPRFLLRQPAHKAAAWKDLLLLTGEMRQ
ncbi:uracil-DNA glycosylase family protein [Sphingomonas baiyangensis]|uniref:Uracil-DNA glycosylase n=1 Tax=Sphingomonas baiyangensis TaxID=2572576 RepID=A0A4U1L3G1_9SPHN|nr:uracil-DNA glycosylase family protein [Sphingomonas baiyangensis]TKD51014.1 uracil-DNA glycosylase [Sphingomonas baiyangensis]